MELKNVLVLGGSGFVGAHVCEKLTRAGYRVTVLTRRRNNARNVQHLPALTVLEVDIHDAQALTQAVAGHHAVVNLVAILHGSAQAFARVHVDLPAKIAQACAEQGVAQLVHISALGVRADAPQSAPSLYLRSKGQGEQILLSAAGAGVTVTVLRPSVIFGENDRFLNLFAALQRIFPVMPLAGAQARFQPVWVEDVASAVVQSLAGAQPTHKGLRVLQAAGPDVMTLRELVRSAGQWAGVNEGRGRPVFALPQALGWLQALAMECLPGAPLMSRDNLASMRVDNVADAQMPGLSALGIEAAALAPIARAYLSRHQKTHGLLGMRQQAGR